MRQFARTTGATVFGARARLVDVQVSVYLTDDQNDRGFRIVGLPDSALREGRERIRAAIGHGDWRWPGGKITVNLAPAAARKEGAALDLPVAMGILAAQGELGENGVARGWLCLGELGLDGSVRSVRGVLAAVEAARRAGIRHALVPAANAAEAASVKGVGAVAVNHLAEAVGHLTGLEPLTVEPPRSWTPPALDAAVSVGIRGQDASLRAAAIAATGRHNLLLWGPPGAGKTLLARQVARWLPPLTYEEALETSRVHSVAGLLSDGLMQRRPFRAPHHTTSQAGLIGGGTIPRPGEISLAHLGVLFLDELAEFDRASLEALRQPLESGRLVLGRAAGRAVFPAEILLMAATNPCPCGWLGADRCKCSPRDVARYQARISGPLWDRFDLQLCVKAVKVEDLVGAQARDGVAPFTAAELGRAHRWQARRAKQLRLSRASNASIPPGLLPGGVEPTPDAQRHLVSHAMRLGLTGRGVHRVLRVARTIADLAGSKQVEEGQIQEAIAYRKG